MAVFEIYRLVLSAPTVGPLFEEIHRVEPEGTRREFLERAFSARRDFIYGKGRLVFVPSPKEARDGARLSGFFGRATSQKQASGPDELFVETETDVWNAAFFTVDISQDQQVVYFEKKNHVGSGLRILEAFFENVSKEVARSWHVDVEYIWEEGDFWKAVEMYRGEITELKFTFAPANGIRGFEAFKEFDQLAKDESNSDVSDYSLKNSNGAVAPSGETIEKAVEYASEGAGEVKLKRGRRELYSSRKSIKTKHVGESIVPRQQRDPMRILGLMNYLFGKRSDLEDD